MPTLQASSQIGPYHTLEFKRMDEDFFGED